MSSAISYTGQSLFSKEDEEREKEELNDAERKELLEDMHGRQESTVDQDEEEEEEDWMTEEDEIALDDLNAEITKLSPEQSEQYYKAWEVAPDLVETESTPLLFLKYQNYNVEQAAIKLCAYWHGRVAIFGEENAFKSMTISQNGAMTKDVIPYLIKYPNFGKVLPNDDYGRTVICWDKTNFRFKDMDDIVYVKIMWFVVQQAIQRKQGSCKGVVYLAIGGDSSWDFPSTRLLKLHLYLISAVPVKICCLHNCVSSLFETCVMPLVKAIFPKNERHRIQIHNCLKKMTLLKQLETEFGLHRNNLPRSIGGNYNDEQSLWIDECERIMKEEEKRKRRLYRRTKRQKYQNL